MASVDVANGRIAMKLPFPVLFASLAILTGCAPGVESEAYVTNAPAARPLGTSVRCLNTSTVTRSVVQDDRTIDFMVGSRPWRNTLPDRCRDLGASRAIAYDVPTGSLCAGDVVYVVDSAGGGTRRTTSCAVGDFVPVEYVRD